MLLPVLFFFTIANRASIFSGHFGFYIKYIIVCACVCISIECVRCKLLKMPTQSICISIRNNDKSMKLIAYTSIQFNCVCVCVYAVRTCLFFCLHTFHTFDPISLGTKLTAKDISHNLFRCKISQLQLLLCPSANFKHFTKLSMWLSVSLLLFHTIFIQNINVVRTELISNWNC